MSLINAHSLDPALLYDAHELNRACERYQVDTQRGENEDDNAHHARLLKVRHICLPPQWINPNIWMGGIEEDVTREAAHPPGVTGLTGFTTFQKKEVLQV